MPRHVLVEGRDYGVTPKRYTGYPEGWRPIQLYVSGEMWKQINAFTGEQRVSMAAWLRDLIERELGKTAQSS